MFFLLGMLQHFNSLRFQRFRAILIRCASMRLLKIDWSLANNQYRIFLRFIQASNNESRLWITKCEPRNKQHANLHNEELPQWLKMTKWCTSEKADANGQNRRFPLAPFARSVGSLMRL